jgi:hypothetical protein
MITNEFEEAAVRLLAAVDAVEFEHRQRGLNAIQENGCEHLAFGDLWRAADALRHEIEMLGDGGLDGWLGEVFLECMESGELTAIAKQQQASP